MNITHEAYTFLKHIYEEKFLIFELVKRDFTSSYSGSYLGSLWALLDTFFFIFILWVVFGYGRGGQVNMNYPFIIHVAIGLISFTFFQDTFNSSATVISQYSFLLKKVDFRPSILPIIKILSNAILHVCSLFILLGLLLFYGFLPTIYWLQVFYYIFAISLMLIGTGLITSSITPFFRDLPNLLNVITRVLFFGTPIFWSTNNLPEKVKFFLMLNPLYYIVSGYRDCFVQNVPFWEHPYLGLYFWAFTLFSLITGLFMYIKLKPHFMDVL